MTAGTPRGNVEAIDYCVPGFPADSPLSKWARESAELATSSATISRMSDFLGVIAGAIVSWVVSWWYYKRAADDFQREVRDLRNLAWAILFELRDAGLIKLNVDELGRVRGVILPTRGRISFAEFEVPSDSAQRSD